MQNDLTEIIKIIQFETGLRDEGIADRIGYTRSHYNTLKKKQDGSLLPLLRKHFNKEIQQFVRRYSKLEPNSETLDQPNADRLEEILTYQKATYQAVQKLEQRINTYYPSNKDKSLDAEVRRDASKGKQSGKGRQSNVEKPS